MISRIFKISSLRTLKGSFIYDNYWSDFVLGFCLQKGSVPRRVSLNRHSHGVKIENIKDLLTINEVFNWQIYKTSRQDQYQYIFDLGSNIGTTALYFSKLHNIKKIFCYEPDPSAFKLLEENCSKVEKDIETINMAITKNGGDVMLNISTSSRYNSINKNHKFEYVSKVKVKSISFDQLFTKIFDFNPSEVLIKIDIEGVEQEFFEYIDQKNVFIGDIVVEGENLPKKFGRYVLKNQCFNDVYYYTEL